MAVAALPFTHEPPFDAHQPAVREIERNGYPRYPIGREPFLCKPAMRPKSYPPLFQLAVQTQDGALQFRPWDGELQVAETQAEQWIVGQRFPGISKLESPVRTGGLVSGLQHIVRSC